MGISGLMTHCNDRRKDISERIDLMQVVRKRANQPGGPLIILVDYYAFESFILPKFLESEREKGGQDFNQHLRLCGGEYEDYDCYVRNFLETLRALGIVFEFYIDAPRGAAVGEADSKMATWRERFQDTVSFFAEIRRVCDGQLDIHRLRDKLVRPALLTLQTLISIKHAGCDVTYCLKEEADRAIGLAMNSRPEAFAALSHDSDFAVMRGCKFIPFEWFDIPGELMACVSGKKQNVSSLWVDVTTPERVAASLGLPSPQALVEVAILKGNDFTKPFLKHLNLRLRLDLDNSSLHSFAEWIAENGEIEKSDYLRETMQTNPGFRLAVEHSRKFYGFPSTSSSSSPTKPLLAKPPSPDPELTAFIEAGVSRGDFPLIFLAMHRGVYWHRELLGVPNVEVALTDLRRILYDMLLPSNESLPSVDEYYRNEEGDLDLQSVNPRGRYPNLQQISTRSENKKIATFCDIFLSMEDSDDSRNSMRESLMSEFTLKERFVILMLRFFMRLTRAFGMGLMPTEANAVMASVCCVMSGKRRTPLKADIQPSFRCLTAFNWLQEIYLYAYNLFGKALGLDAYFPQPCDLFEGATFVRLFMSVKGETVGKETRAQRECREEIQDWLDENRPLVNAVYKVTCAVWPVRDIGRKNKRGPKQKRRRGRPSKKRKEEEEEEEEVEEEEEDTID